MGAGGASALPALGGGGRGRVAGGARGGGGRHAGAGPQLLRLINYLDGALLWPDQHGGRRVDRGVALLSQSSNIVINLTMQRRALPVAYVACLGNAAQVGLRSSGVPCWPMSG